MIEQDIVQQSAFDLLKKDFLKIIQANINSNNMGDVVGMDEEWIDFHLDTNRKILDKFLNSNLNTAEAIYYILNECQTFNELIYFMAVTPPYIKMKFKKK